MSLLVFRHINRSKASSLLNNEAARAFGVSVLPTPDPPTKRKVPMGLFMSFKPALFLRIALDKADKA